VLVGVGEGVARGEGVSVPVSEGTCVEGGLGVALGEEPRVMEGVAVRDRVGEALGAERNRTLATKPLSCTLMSVTKEMVSMFPVVVQEPSVLPEYPVTSAGKAMLGPLKRENLSQHSSVCM